MSQDIQREDFIAEFDMKQATIGMVGYGFIGNSVVELFRPFAGQVLIYDKEKSPQGFASGDTRSVKKVFDNVDLCTLREVVIYSEVIFVAVPTPMKPTGECHTDIVESVLQDIQNQAVSLSRDLGSFVVVIKSTVPPGFTKQMQEKYALRIVFSPEFLTEANAVRDFKTTNRVLLGGDEDDARIVFKYFEAVWPDRQLNTYTDHPDGPVQIVQCDPTTAEMVKLSTNAHLMAKVLLSNELYLICQKLGIPYDDVKLLTQFDRRIGMSHMNVPGPDGNPGAGGHCFPKDISNLRFVAKQLGTGEKLFTAIHERNLEIREDRDWESQKGRAVIDG